MGKINDEWLNKAKAVGNDRPSLSRIHVVEDAVFATDGHVLFARQATMHDEPPGIGTIGPDESGEYTEVTLDAILLHRATLRGGHVVLRVYKKECSPVELYFKKGYAMILPLHNVDVERWKPSVMVGDAEAEASKKRTQRLKEIRENSGERPYIVAFNIGYDDFPNKNNPFEEGGEMRLAWLGYEQGFSTAEDQNDPNWTYGDEEE